MQINKKIFGIAILSMLLIGPLLPVTSMATWQENGNPVCIATGTQWYPQIVHVGNGSVIITWADPRTAGTPDIYAQKLNSTGDPQWLLNGVPVCTAAGYQAVPKICSDGEDGAIITWYDARNGGVDYYDIYAQRINSTGHPQWGPNGTIVCNADNEQMYVRILAGENGSAIIGWVDYRNTQDIYVQLLNASGHPQWGANGTALQSVAAGANQLDLCSDGAGGAIAVWIDGRGGSYSDIYAQKINSTGDIQWTLDGIVVCNETYEQTGPQLVSDGAGGATIIWLDNREDASEHDFFAQRINSAGFPQWGTNGKLIFNDTTASDQRFGLIGDGSGGAIIAIESWNAGSYVFAQKINAVGTVLWGVNGKPVISLTSQTMDPAICSDGSGGAIVAFADYRSGANIYAQRFDSSGNRQWGSAGIAICSANSFPGDLEITAVEDGDAIVVWEDDRNGTSNEIYANLITAPEGSPGIPGFTLFFVGLGVLTLILIAKQKSKVEF